MTVDFDVLEIVAEPGLMLYTYSAQPRSASDDSLHLLASWAASNSEQLTHP